MCKHKVAKMKEKETSIRSQLAVVQRVLQTHQTQPMAIGDLKSQLPSSQVTQGRNWFYQTQ